ncbi:MAG: PAS domain S-box protein [Melioribacteraceae bacterium]|nr:PAS domain S-box protein [Melioribacteraceae bacterium]
MEKDLFEIFSHTSQGLPVFSSKDELIKSFLNCFKKITECRSVSIYLVDQNSFEMVLSGTEGENTPEKINNIFHELVENEVIASLLNNPNETLNYTAGDFKFYLMPVKRNESVAGFFLFVYRYGDEPEPGKVLLLNHYCNYFSLQLINIDHIKNEIYTVDGKTSMETGKPPEIMQLVEQNILLNSLQEGILFVDKNTGKIIDVNEPATNLLKIKKEKVIGTSKDRYFLFMDKNIFRDEIITQDETLSIAADGTVFPVLYSSTVFNMYKTDYEVISFLDISERKSMEDLILQSRFHLEQQVEERTKELSITNEELRNQINERIKKEQENLILYLAIQQSPAHVILTNLEGKIEFVNNAFLKQTGYSFDEVVNQTPRILKSGDIKPEDYIQLWENIKSGKPWICEFRNKKKDGNLYWVSSQISPIVDSNGNIIKYLAIQEDISQRKNYEAELIDSKEKIEKAYHFKDALLANMSHEFRTPLISIIGCSDLLIEDLAEGEMFDMARAIQQGGNRLLRTLNNVLLLSDLESGSYNFEMVPKNVIPIVRTMFDKYSYIAASKNLNLLINVEENELIIQMNEFFFNKAIESIIDNAIKYMQVGTVVITIKKARLDGRDYGAIIVEDNGIGIPDQEKQIVFEAFRQAEEGHKRNYEGTGLGLTIAQKAISNMNGFIKLEDNYPLGSKFIIQLPLENNY